MMRKPPGVSCTRSADPSGADRGRATWGSLTPDLLWIVGFLARICDYSIVLSVVYRYSVSTDAGPIRSPRPVGSAQCALPHGVLVPEEQHLPKSPIPGRVFPERILQEKSYTVTTTATDAKTGLSRVRVISAATQGETEDDFAHEVRRGLSSARKYLPCRFIYDSTGSQLFEQICELPEYYLTRAETEILSDNVHDIAKHISKSAGLIELGSGSAEKTRILIRKLLDLHGQLQFFPIDISRTALADSAAALTTKFPGLNVTGIAGEYLVGLDVVVGEWSGPKCVLWLGSSVGNFEREDAIDFTKRLRAHMNATDVLIIGVDLRKQRAVLEAAYDDAKGVTARFNKNILVRINRELGGNFDITQFRHSATYNADHGRIESSLVSTEKQDIVIDKLDMTVSFSKGESIHTENSYKYSLQEIDDLADAAGFCINGRWLDSDRRFSLNLLIPNPTGAIGISGDDKDQTNGRHDRRNGKGAPPG